MSNNLITRLMVGVLGAVLSTQAAPLNVIVVMTDDQGYGDIAFNGNPVIKTPNMDRLAASSVRFTDFHVNSFCSPSRAALMTGRMSDRTGVTTTNGYRNYMRQNEVIMPEYFKASGYGTGIFGKWHIGANYPLRPMDRGFDEWIGLGNNGLATANDVWDNDRMDDRYYHNGEIVSRPGFCTDVYFSEAMTFMTKCQKEKKPFFAYIATNVPHWDWNVPESWLEPYLGTESRDRSAFYASIHRADWNLGRLMDYLDQQNLSENTILVFLTDNGSDLPQKNKNAYSAGMRGFKGDLYEGGHRVPCFIRAPKGIMGEPGETDALAAHIDLLPTFIDICSLKTPNREVLPMDGRSLKPLLSGGSDWDDRLLIHHSQNGSPTKKDARLVVMTADWRLVNNKKSGKPELFAIRTDRGQKTDVASQFPEVVESLQARYDTHWKSLGLDRPQQIPSLSGNATLRLSPVDATAKNKNTQQAVRKAEAMPNPKWAFNVEEAGRYRFEVRRWPREAPVPMTAGLEPANDPNIEYIGHKTFRIDVPGVAIAIDSVELKLADKTLTRAVSKEDQGAVFEADLTTGPLELEAWFITPNQKRRGAYYVYAEKI
ncbi:arylsulfatase [Pontiella sulfatireligans]|uniref:Arylsulfatase n=1 Tax=Pontiella sulfatireligans TaxID=2750658 RepID=A0A6C2UGJ8_9BACT|nr:arylsulfatase [Pontiella sulfatireligans]SPS74181.1 sulfatase S1_17 [Kiritimatiellales bacterium]VGO18541.1 Arylsulfatase [Pontiella sulfatireligans]